MARIIYAREAGAPLHVKKTRPNDPCPCGSGKKAKHCCGRKSEYFTLKKKADDTQHH